MLSTSLTLAAFAVASVSALAVPRGISPPKGWWTTGLEDYQTYHTRYLALDCQDQHNTDFFAACCHPLLKDQSLSSRPAECDPTNDCDDDGSDDNDGSDDCSSTDAPAPSSAAAPAPVSSSEAPAATSSAPVPSSSEAPVNVAPAPTSEAPAPSTTSSATPAPSPTSSTPAPAPTSSQSSNDNNNNNNNNNNNGGDSGVLLSGSGGVATFFFQNGVAGSCGTVHSDSDPVVALDSAIVDGGKWCGKHITITNTDNQKTVTAIVADTCPTCSGANSIDLSRGAFQAIADFNVGQVPVVWKITN